MNEVSLVHQFNPEMAPDSAFVPGTLTHLVVGNRGRLMDPRRTPVRILLLIPQTGHFVVEVEDFEDKGAQWEIPFERIASYQFNLESAEAPPVEAKLFADVVHRFNRPFHVACDRRAVASTSARLTELQKDASAWLAQNSLFLQRSRRFDQESRRGPHELCSDLQRFMEARGSRDLEQVFAARYVGTPRACELVKGHRIVMAELGLVPYEGTIVRDPDLFDGAMSKKRRTEHILNRLAFLRALFSIVGCSAVTLYRGLVFDGRPDPPRNETFVSASFDFDVAQSCFAPLETGRAGLITRQVVPVERLFMTYLETAEMNRQYLEAEAVLLHEPGNPLF